MSVPDRPLSAGICVRQQRGRPSQSREERLRASWDLLEPLVTHLLRVVNIYSHLAGETQPASPQNRSGREGLACGQYTGWSEVSGRVATRISCRILLGRNGLKGAVGINDFTLVSLLQSL